MDLLTRGTALNEEVRVACCRTTEIVQYARSQHDLWPTATAALGRTLSMAAIMGSFLKTDKEKIEIQINGGGELGQIVADGYFGGNVRGYVQNPHVYKTLSADKLDVGGAVGTAGFLRVIKDMGMKQPFVSEVKLQTGELGDDFSFYYYESEQTPSVVALGVLVGTDTNVESAGGLIIQLLPNATEETFRIVEDIARNLKPISQLMKEFNDPKEILDAIFEDYQELDSREIRFTCECSKARFARVLKKLEKEELEAMINEDHGCEVVCHFCGRRYQFSEETLRGYLNAKKQ